MKKMLVKKGNVTGLRGSGNVSGLSGDVTALSGDVTNLRGNVTGLRGYVTGLSGYVTGLIGDVDECGLTESDRQAGVEISELIVEEVA